VSATARIGAGERPWRRAALWLAGLAPFFYLTYGTANWLASLRPAVPAAVFGWERHIPFLDWTILPYWSINLFYGASLFVCTTPAELDRHGRRLLTAQVIAVACFLVVPLRFTFERPEAGGVARFLFDALTSFDRPFNQAPSLHIALLVILWDLYARHLPGRWHPALHAWFALIGLSVLTTYQHCPFVGLASRLTNAHRRGDMTRRILTGQNALTGQTDGSEIQPREGPNRCRPP
jgi:hypothetical protein